MANLALAQPNVSPLDAAPDDERDRFYLVLGGHIFFQTLAAAVELDLFTLLKRDGAPVRGAAAAASDFLRNTRAPSSAREKSLAA